MLVINSIGKYNNNKYLSQRDERWANIILGGGQLTVGRYGCTTTCLSMLTDFFDCYQDPGVIAKNKNNYVKNGSSINWIGLDFPKFSFRWRDGSMVVNNPVINLDMVKAYLAHNDNRKEDRDRAVLLEVANGSHWVLGLWNTIDGDILCIDPWNGTTCELFKTYQNITAACYFVRWDKTKNKGRQAWQGAKEPVAPKYN